MKLIVNKYQGTKNQNESLWYGGKVAEIIKDDKTYTIEAIGDIRCDLIAKHDTKINDIGYKKGDVILNIIDKNNSGEFKRKIEEFIKNDDELNDLILNDNPDYKLVFENNNWLEVFYDNGESDILDCATIDEAISDVLEKIKDKIKLENNNIIYCRSANLSEFAVKKQEEICKCHIFDNTDNHSYDLFVDNGISGLDPFENPAFSSMINLSEKGKMFYAKDITRLSRNLQRLTDIKEIFKNSNSDIFLVNDNKYVYKELLKKVELPLFFEEICNNEEKLENREKGEIEYE